MHSEYNYCSDRIGHSFDQLAIKLRELAPFRTRSMLRHWTPAIIDAVACSAPCRYRSRPRSRCSW
jgi:hypothetical protein